MNSLENMGYRVVTSGAFTVGQGVFDRLFLGNTHNPRFIVVGRFSQREFIWTLHRTSSELECV